MISDFTFLIVITDFSKFSPVAVTVISPSEVSAEIYATALPEKSLRFADL